MKAASYICDTCRKPISDKGYSASIDKGCKPVGFDLLSGIAPEYDHHYCGKQCLLAEINQRIDGMDKAEDADTSPARELRPTWECKRPYTERRSTPQGGVKAA